MTKIRTDQGTFFGQAGSVSIQTALTAEPTAAPAGGTGATGGAYDTAGNRDTMITCVNDTRTRLGEIETILSNLGILP